MRRPRPRAALGAVAAAAVCLLGLATVPTSSAFSARVTNPTNTAATASYFTCTGAETAPTGDYLVYPLNDASGTTAKDVSGNTRTGTYTSAGVTYGTAGPCTRDTPSTAITLNGSSGYVLYSGATQNTNVFSEEIWFKTSTTTGGKLMGWGNNKTNTASGSYDRHIYMANNGTVYFGVYPGSVKTITNGVAYNDNRWHQVVASLSTAGMVLYVDGAQVAQDTATTTAQSFAGYLHLGFDNVSGWTSTPTSQYFAGSLAYAAYYTTVLTAQQVSDHYAAGT